MNPLRSMPKTIYQQSGVIAYRHLNDALQILLVTSRSGKRWVIPKGLVEPHMTPWDSAAKEAMEEAGVEGEVETRCLGEFDYEKWGGVCRVAVYPMRVTTEFDDWEEDERVRQWLRPEVAAFRVREMELRLIIREFSREYSRCPFDYDE